MYHCQNPSDSTCGNSYLHMHTCELSIRLNRERNFHVMDQMSLTIGRSDFRLSTLSCKRPQPQTCVYVHTYMCMYNHSSIYTWYTHKYKPEGRGLESRWGNWIFQCIWTFQPHRGLGVYSANNRNMYQKIFLRVNRVRRVRLTTLLPYVSRLSRKCGKLDIAQT
jgi:hypothetical protein